MIILLLLLLLPMAYGSTWEDDVKVCTDIWQETRNDTLYYRCWTPMEESHDD